MLLAGAVSSSVSISFVEKLRRLADIIEQNELPISYSGVDLNRDSISLLEDDFRKLFKGQYLSGVRRGQFVDCEEEAFGLVFKGSVYVPIAVGHDEKTTVAL